MTPINVKYFQKDESVVGLPGSLEFMEGSAAGLN